MVWNGKEIDPRYRFKRQTLYDWLAPIIPDNLLHELRAIIPDEVARERDKARNRSVEGRYATNYTGQGVRASNEEKRATARLLRAQGRTYRAIAAELDMNEKTIRNWCRDAD